MPDLEKTWEALLALRVAYRKIEAPDADTATPWIVALIDALESLETRVVALETERVYQRAPSPPETLQDQQAREIKEGHEAAEKRRR